MGEKTFFPSDEAFDTVSWLEYKRRDLQFHIKSREENILALERGIALDKARILGYKKGIEDIDASIRILESKGRE